MKRERYLSFVFVFGELRRKEGWIDLFTPPPPIMTMLADHAARQLLDFNQKLDINLLDNVVNCLYHGEGAQQRMAQEVLTHLKEHPDAWTRVDTILEFSQNMNTK
ncbi:Exportin-1, partial [Ophiophagus hannah]